MGADSSLLSHLPAQLQGLWISHTAVNPGQDSPRHHCNLQHGSSRTSAVCDTQSTLGASKPATCQTTTCRNHFGYFCCPWEVL